MTPAERRKHEAERLRRKRRDPTYLAAENARSAARARDRRAMTGRALRITFSDSLPSLVSIALRDLTARPASTNQPDA
jgi:hypothetical protein